MSVMLMDILIQYFEKKLSVERAGQRLFQSINWKNKLKEFIYKYLETRLSLRDLLQPVNNLTKNLPFFLSRTVLRFLNRFKKDKVLRV